MSIYDDVKDLDWWAVCPNATGQPQARPLQKLVAAIGVFACGEPPDSVEDYVRLSKSTIHETAKRLVLFTLGNYRDVYLRAPTREDLERIMARNAERGLPGCIGSLESSH